MKTRNLLYVILLSALCFASSCEQKAPEYVPGEAPTGAQVFFPNDIQVGTITLDETKPISIPIVRANDAGALSVTINSNAFTGFEIPATVEFAAGTKNAELVINYDITQFKRGDSYDVNITLGNDTTFYGVARYNFTVYINPWESLGMGQWYDALALESNDSFGIQSVEILHNGVQPELYRIMNPYANDEQLAKAWSPENIGGPKSEYIEFKVLEDGVHVSWNKWWYTGLIYTPGDESSSIKAYLPSALSAAQAPNDKYSQFFSVISENDLVRFVPYYYIDGVGGFGLMTCYLSFPGGPDLEDII